MVTMTPRYGWSAAVALAAVSAGAGWLPASSASELPQKNVRALMASAAASGSLGLARKTRAVDARPAKPGEIIETIIAGQGRETISPPAKPGDWVVRNRCPETGNEQILVEAAKFATRYSGPDGAPDPGGWAAFSPTGTPMHYFIVPVEAGPFEFEAPWGEVMSAKPGDAIVQSPTDPADTYRIAAAAFACTYEVLEPARNPN